MVPARRMSQAFTWVTPWTLKGLVEVRIDGEVASRSGPGPLGAGAMLPSGEAHVVVLQATRPMPGSRLGLAIYRFPPHLSRRSLASIPGRAHIGSE